MIARRRWYFRRRRDLGRRSDLKSYESSGGRVTWTGAASQTIDGDEERGPFKHLHEPVEKSFVVVMFWLKIFFKNALGFTDSLNGEFLIAHCLELHAIEPPI